MKLTAISVAWLFATSFDAAAAVRFIPNPLLGPDGLFVANPAHKLVHALDNFLHLGLGAAIGAAGFYFHAPRGSMQASPAVLEG